MHSKRWTTNAVALLALIAAACGGSSPSAATSPAATASPIPSATATATASPPAVVAGTTIATAPNSSLGTILVDSKGISLYLFVADKSTSSTCYTTCAQIWPPVLTSGAPVAGTGAQASLLGTTTRTDGKVEVTYAGHPLYYFVQDKKPGDATGQGINGFGGLWWVVSPAGTAIH